MRRLRAPRTTGRGLVATWSLLLLAACGGGGGDDPVAATYDLDATLTRLLQTPLRFDNLQATDPLGNVYTLSLAYAPAADAVFEGATRRTSQQTVTLTAAGSSVTTLASMYFDTAPFREAGSISDDGSYSVALSTGDLPAAASVGAGGPLFTETAYTDSSKSFIAARAVTTWSLEPDTDTSAFACLKAVVTMIAAADTATQTTCYRITPAGAVLGARVTLSTAGVTLEFR